MKDWQEDALKLHKFGGTYREIAQALQLNHPGFEDINDTYQRVRRFLYKHHMRHADKDKEYIERSAEQNISSQGLLDNSTVRLMDDIVNQLHKGTTIEELCETTHLSESLICAIIEEIKNKGRNVLQLGDEYKISNIVLPENNVVKKDWKGERIVRFGLTGDNHSGSIYTQIGLLHKAYEIFKEEGIDTVYHTGDITEGENMRQGHAYECYVHGADQHIAEIVKNYPCIDGIKTEFIDGNHDGSFIKHAGLNIGKLISNERKDMVYLGHSQAYVHLTPKCILELRHPAGGSAYAISYKSQKIVESLFGGTKPNILAFGHFHKMEYLFYRNVHVFQTGTLQGQSSFMRDLGLASHMGVWIIEVRVGEDGGVDRICPTMIPFYHAVENDYLNWR